VSQALLSLTPSELRMLAGAIRMGRLSVPFSGLSLSQLIQGCGADSLTQDLNEMSALGMPASGIAHAVELLAASMADRPRIEDLVHLVATGPSVSGVANRDTSVVVGELFSKAEESVLVVGYAVYQGQKVFQALAKRMNERPELKVRMYLDIARKAGDTAIEPDLVRRFCYHFRTTQWPSEARMPEVYYDPRSAALERGDAASLHAKCVVVDLKEVFVSSANFTEAGQTRNIELGMLFKSRGIAERVGNVFEQFVAGKFLKKAM
jgi:phosphatidylserine/phosphatidylglycerophosphate/cardiolipin synthase-like enzyme